MIVEVAPVIEQSTKSTVGAGCEVEETKQGKAKKSARNRTKLQPALLAIDDSDEEFKQALAKIGMEETGDAKDDKEESDVGFDANDLAAALKSENDPDDSEAEQ